MAEPILPQFLHGILLVSNFFVAYLVSLQWLESILFANDFIVKTWLRSREAGP